MDTVDENPMAVTDAQRLFHCVMHCATDVRYNHALLLNMLTLMFERQYLVVLHTKGVPHAHYHIQGLLRNEYMNPTTQRALINRVRDAHPDYVKGKTRPIVVSRKDVNETGYQYMMHDGRDTVVDSRGFTSDQLDELYELSMEVRDAKKHNLVNHLKRKFPGHPVMGVTEDEYPTSEAAHQVLRREAAKYLRETKAEHVNANHVRDVIFTFYLTAPWAKPEDVDYLSRKF